MTSAGEYFNREVHCRSCLAGETQVQLLVFRERTDYHKNPQLKGNHEVMNIIHRTLSCPDCRKAVEVPDDKSLVCALCRRIYPVEDGVHVLMPSRAPEDNRGANDAEYQKWLKVSSDLLQNFYERGSPLLHAIHHSSHKTAARYCRKLPSAGLTLDLGCGAGAHYPYYRDLKNVVGLDISMDNLRRVKAEYPEASLVRGNCYRLPFKDSAFQVVLSMYNLEHLFHLKNALDEVRRVLSPGGAFIVGLPCVGGFLWDTAGGWKARRKYRTLGIDYDRVIAIEHCNKARDILREIKQTFRVESVSWFPLVVIPSVNINLTVTVLARRK